MSDKDALRPVDEQVLLILFANAFIDIRAEHQDPSKAYWLAQLFHDAPLAIREGVPPGEILAHLRTRAEKAGLGEYLARREREAHAAVMKQRFTGPVQATPNPASPVTKA